jgi:hypothetical protein
MKELGEASYILRITIYRGQKKILFVLSQGNYIDKILTRFTL